MRRMTRNFGCCSCTTNHRNMTSNDFDQPQLPQPHPHPHPHIGTVTYDGLESCISKDDHFTRKETESMNKEEDCDDSSCSSAGSPYISSWSVKDDQETEKWDPSDYKPSYDIHFSDIHSMKEKFSKLLLGEDVTGGTKGISPALALSNAITNLADCVFGELWKLEPVAEEAKNRWAREMDWLVSPANYIVELVPAKQCGSNGLIFEIMTPKLRADVHLTLPALRKLDSMLIETLDSMEKTEFWYAEGSNHKQGAIRESKRWWLPYPRVPVRGLSASARKGLISQANLVHQLFKASKSINQSILSQMPLHKAAALPKSGRETVGENIYRVLADESCPTSQMADSMKLKSDHEALDAINKLEAAQLVWRGRLREPKSRFFTMDPSSDASKIGSLVFKAEILMQQLRLSHPNLPPSFLDVTKIQYGKDIGYAVMEAYSRALADLAYKILMRIGEVLQEDHANNPTSPVSMGRVPGLLSPKWIQSPAGRGRLSLEDGMSSYFSDSNPSRRSSDLEISSRMSSAMNTPSSSRIWCIGGEAFRRGSP